jgi:hypothetical protein
MDAVELGPGGCQEAPLRLGQPFRQSSEFFVDLLQPSPGVAKLLGVLQLALASYFERSAQALH